MLQNTGHKVIAVQLAAHSLADDVATVKRAIDLVGGPTILVGHSYGGFVITNAGYNNKNVTGLVYVAHLLLMKVNLPGISSMLQNYLQDYWFQIAEDLCT